MSDDIKEIFMRLAIEEGKKGLGRTSPNPAVGALVLRDGEIIGKGYHHKYGESHAEVNAINDAKIRANDLTGCEIYVTLAPCNHHGKTPPCTKAIMESGIKTVYIGSSDPNNRADTAEGILNMRKHGITVHTGVAEAECDELLRFFRKYTTTRLPYLSAKVAMSLDGYIAAKDGSSRWITNDKARSFGHHLRDIHDGILVGASTVLHDNPELTCRIPGGRNPKKILVLGAREIPLTAKVFDNAPPIIVITDTLHPKAAIEGYISKGAIIIDAPNVIFSDILKQLASEHNIQSILVEGGSRIISNLTGANLIDRFYIFYAPVLLGSVENKYKPFDLLNIPNIKQAKKLQFKEVSKFDDDILAIYDIVR